jgi:hypothetical protein
MELAEEFGDFISALSGDYQTVESPITFEY